MADSKETIFKKAEQRLKDLSALKINPSTGMYTVDGKSLNTFEYKDAVTKARIERDQAKIALDTEKSKQSKEAKRVSGEKSKQQKQIDQLKRSRKILSNEIKNLSDDIQRRDTSSISGKEISLERKQELINDKATRIRQIDISLGVLEPKGADAAPATQAQTQATTGPLQGEVQGPFLEGAGEVGRAAAADRIASTTGTGAATTGRGRGRGSGKTKQEKQPKLPANWEAKFREMFPGQSWLLDLDKTKYPTLFALIQRGVADKMWETPEAQARFAAELDNTDFFTELRNTDKVRTIKSLVGDLGFDQTPFNKFLATASNFGWEGDTLKSEVYKEAFRKDDAGNYVNPTALSRAKKSTDWLKASSIGKQFFTTISDNFIEQRLTGVLTDEDLLRQQRELAKTKFSHLGNLIDQGFTLEELSNSFRQQAAALLERDVNDIDMGSADFEAAYNYGEPGQKRMMTSGEWEILLRSDQKYGWDKTQNAKQEARTLASSIAQAFGRII